MGVLGSILSFTWSPEPLQEQSLVWHQTHTENAQALEVQETRVNVLIKMGAYCHPFPRKWFYLWTEMWLTCKKKKKFLDSKSALSYLQSYQGRIYKANTSHDKRFIKVWVIKKKSLTQSCSTYLIFLMGPRPMWNQWEVKWSSDASCTLCNCSQFFSLLFSNFQVLK